MSKLWTEEELLGVLNEWFDSCAPTPKNEQALWQIKNCIGEAYAIPTTSERESELEEVIWEMQKELDKESPSK